MADLPPHLQEALVRAGWPELMPVQAKALPYLLARRDLMVQSRTGSGKTGAFVLPILDRVDTRRAVCQALVLVPTRELARQVARDAETLAGGAGDGSGVRVVAVYGGVGYGPQLEAFRQGAHLVVGTPGRILDHLLRRSLSLEHLQILVFDEADRMLSMGFYPDMRRVQEYLPNHRVNAYMFSATFPPRVMSLARQFLHQPDFLSLSRDRVYVAETEHVYYVVPGMGKVRSLVRIIEVENPDAAMVFCNTRSEVHYVTEVLRRFGYDAAELSSDLPQDARDRVLTRLRQGKLRFLVATDVASRGIDIPELSHIILYEPPEDPEDYIHRAGRTGRAGASGTAISLVSLVEQTRLNQIAKRYNLDLHERPLPSDEDVQTVVAERVIALLEARLRSRDRVEIERMQRFVPLAQSLAQGEGELPLIAMLLDDLYQQSLQAPSAPVETLKPAAKKPKPKRQRSRR
ncbi:MAG: DEAD/DEAH box helicase [Chloroflexi bacterium]|nr:DEAD/DEAH box helicase [Chloroflexota bacterium]MBU1750301.1 DEAD/DEAH box helicase [Chloroflexota bacterium]